MQKTNKNLVKWTNGTINEKSPRIIKNNNILEPLELSLTDYNTDNIWLNGNYPNSFIGDITNYNTFLTPITTNFNE